jgi:hypothetical protein
MSAIGGRTLIADTLTGMTGSLALRDHPGDLVRLYRKQNLMSYVEIIREDHVQKALSKRR